MTAKNSPATRVAAALRGGLAAAEGAGASAVAAEHLTRKQLTTLTDATLDHLRSQPGEPSVIEGWTLVTARDAAVMAWWVKAAELTTSERRRLEPLRQDLYDVLTERNLVVRDEEHRTSLHISPAEQPQAEAQQDEQPQAKLHQDEAPQAEAQQDEQPQAELHQDEAPAAPESDDDSTVEVVPSGAWVLKLSPYLYDVNRVFGAADRRVRVWSVEDHGRSASMQYGDPVYLWVGDGDPYRAAGVWGVGYVAGPTVLGIADEGWLDYEAATRASVFAVVDITLLDAPVGRETFLEDARLADAEVIVEPLAANPGVLTAAEHEALAEHLAWLATVEDVPTADEQVA